MHSSRQYRRCLRTARTSPGRRSSRGLRTQCEGRPGSLRDFALGSYSDKLYCTMRTLVQFFLISTCAVLSFAADATGKWKAVYEIPEGQKRESTFDLKAE